jgi:hypothetical protein
MQVYQSLVHVHSARGDSTLPLEEYRPCPLCSFLSASPQADSRTARAHFSRYRAAMRALIQNAAVRQHGVRAVVRAPRTLI